MPHVSPRPVNPSVLRPPQASYANKYEEALWEKPGFKDLIDNYRNLGEMNSLNYATEYIMDPRNAKIRYGGTKPYEKTVLEVEAALKRKIEQKVRARLVASC